MKTGGARSKRGRDPQKLDSAPSECICSHSRAADATPHDIIFGGHINCAQSCAETNDAENCSCQVGFFIRRFSLPTRPRRRTNKVKNCGRTWWAIIHPAFGWCSGVVMIRGCSWRELTDGRIARHRSSSCAFSLCDFCKGSFSVSVEHYKSWSLDGLDWTSPRLDTTYAGHWFNAWVGTRVQCDHMKFLSLVFHWNE